MTVNRQWRLARRPRGMVQSSDFTWTEGPVPSVDEGQTLVRNLFLSMDPTQRGWMSRDTYIPAIAIGDVIRSFGVGQVVGSRHEGFKPGDLVQGGVGWQDYLLSDGGGPLPLAKLPPGTDIPLAMNVLGLTGITAYFGLLEVGRPEAGETVVVSGAAGATGSVVGQIAKIKGCRVVGIAGGPEKCAWLTEKAGFDAAIDYKAERADRRLRDLCPDGIDVFFDNVGGEVLDMVLDQLRLGARIVICGAISQYLDGELSQGVRGPSLYLRLAERNARMEGFAVNNCPERYEEAEAALAGWLASGQIQQHEHIEHGLERFGETLGMLFTGGHMGKLLLAP